VHRQLEDRKLIERAKGILMKERALSESDAYAVLRKAAMNENRRIADIARSIVATMGLPK
jgi:response regulator NasT